jgi:hypothetical protein
VGVEPEVLKKGFAMMLQGSLGVGVGYAAPTLMVPSPS